MITAAEREAEFRKDFEDLLIKHNLHVEYDHETSRNYFVGYTDYTDDDFSIKRDFVEFNL